MRCNKYRLKFCPDVTHLTTINSQGQKRPHTAQHMRDVSTSREKQVTMPVNTRQRASSPTSRTSRSPEALVRSSSSASYHSASLYEEAEDHIVPYSANVETPVPNTLVQSKKSSTKKSGNHQSRFTSLKHQSSGSALSSSSSSPSKAHSSGYIIQEFRNAVRVWSSERVERVLEKDEGVDVDMVINEEVQVYTQNIYFHELKASENTAYE